MGRADCPEGVQSQRLIQDTAGPRLKILSVQFSINSEICLTA